jgi:hypothetical protein
MALKLEPGIFQGEKQLKNKLRKRVEIGTHYTK